MSHVRITYQRMFRLSPYLTRRIVHAPAWMSDARARACVFGFIRGFDRIERDSHFIFDAAGKPRKEAAA